MQNQKMVYSYISFVSIIVNLRSSSVTGVVAGVVVPVAVVAVVLATTIPVVSGR